MTIQKCVVWKDIITEAFYLFFNNKELRMELQNESKRQEPDNRAENNLYTLYHTANWRKKQSNEIAID